MATARLVAVGDAEGVSVACGVGVSSEVGVTAGRGVKVGRSVRVGVSVGGLTIATRLPASQASSASAIATRLTSPTNRLFFKCNSPSQRSNALYSGLRKSAKRTCDYSSLCGAGIYSLLAGWQPALQDGCASRFCGALAHRPAIVSKRRLKEVETR